MTTSEICSIIGLLSVMYWIVTGFVYLYHYDTPKRRLKRKIDFLIDLKEKVEEIPDTIVYKETYRETIKADPYSSITRNIPIYDYEYKSNQDKKLEALKIYADTIKAFAKKEKNK